MSLRRLSIRYLQRPLQSKLIGHRLFDDGALKEVPVIARVQTRSVGKRELPEILLRYKALLDQLKCFGNHFFEIGHVEMREVGAEDGPKSDAHTRIEGPHRCPIVGLAAEVEIAGEDRSDIFF